MKVAVVGATGLVGSTIVKVMDERKLDCELIPIASERSDGAEVPWRDKEIQVESLTRDKIPRVDFALFAVDASLSREIAPLFIDMGAVVVDNSSAFRLDDGIPLIVPSVNGGVLTGSEMLIANPNCSTIQMVVALAPLAREYGLRRVIVSTYQAVSGAGRDGLDALNAQRMGNDNVLGAFLAPIYNNVIPIIGELTNGYTEEEWKLVHETRKLLRLPALDVVPTAVRVPVSIGHSESVLVELMRDVDIDDILRLLSSAPGVRMNIDKVPTPLEAAGQDDVLVGRVRYVPDRRDAIAMWVVADNLRRGAATNAVEIMELIAASSGLV